MAVPTYDKLFNPLLQAMHELGGSGVTWEINEKVANILKLSEEDLNQIHRGTTTKLNYRLAWARNYLKRYGLLENSAHRVWVLTPEGRNTKKIDEAIVRRKVKQMSEEVSVENEVEKGEEPEQSKQLWQEKLIEKLLKMSPESFEQLCQRLLREAGFTRVEVTGKSGDGGIDGKGILRMNGLLSFHIIFQCKRYSGSVSPSQIRDFRGAMTGRADKGLFITTGSFTRDARIEAARDGAPPIDLVDGEQLVEKLKELKLGVNVKLIEDVEVDDKWFSDFK